VGNRNQYLILSHEDDGASVIPASSSHQGGQGEKGRGKNKRQPRPDRRLNRTRARKLGQRHRN